MNQFKTIDNVYKKLGMDCHGEIVTVSISFLECGWTVPEISTDFYGKQLSVWWKRKQSYVPASVNAFHMHRGLCADLRAHPWFSTLSVSQQRATTKVMALCVLSAYVNNARTGSQAMSFVVNVQARRRDPAIPFCTTSAVMLEAALGYRNIPMVLPAEVTTDWLEIANQA